MTDTARGLPQSTNLSIMTLNNNIVSVIIPTYNSAKYLTSTIESVLEQSYKELEIIIVDDVSYDHTEVLVSELQKQDSRIIYIKLKQNSGAAIARNIGIENSKGRFIAFLDSDDLWDRYKIEKQVNVLKNGTNGFCFTSYSLIDEKGNKLKNKINIKREIVDYSYILKRTIISTPTVVIDRQKVQDITFPNRRTGQDYALWLILLKKTKTANCINEDLVKVRKRNSSLSSNKLQNIIDVWEIHRDITELNVLNRFINIASYILFTVLKRFFLV